MRWKLSSPEPSSLVHYSVKLTGLAPFIVRGSKLCPPTVIHVLYQILITATYLLFTVKTFHLELQEPDESDDPKLANIAVPIYHFQGLLIALFTPVVFLLLCKRVAHLINRLCMVGIEVGSLVVKEDREKYFKHVLATTGIANVGLVTTFVALCFIETRWHVYATIKNGFENWIILNTLLIFTEVLRYIGCRFAQLNQTLQDMFTAPEHIGPLEELQMRLRSCNPTSEVLIQRILQIERLQLALCDLINQTTSLFTISIIFISFYFVVDLILSCSWLYYLVQISTWPTGIEGVVSLAIDNLLSPIIRITVVIVELLVVARASTRTRDERNAVRTTLSKAWNVSMPQDVQDEFFTFHLQLIHESGSVRILGFFDLDYSYVNKIVCAVVAYLIVMIQAPGTS